MGVILGDYQVGQRVTTADGAVWEFGPDGQFAQVSPPPDAYSGSKTMVTSQPLPSDYTLKPDALVQGARDAGLVNGLASILPDAALWNMGMSGAIQQGVPSSVGAFDPKTNKLTLTPEMLQQANSALNMMGPLGDFGRSTLMGKNNLVSQYATPTVPPAETFPLPIPRPTPPSPPPASASDPFVEFYTGSMAPPTPYGGNLYQTQGLKKNTVQTVPIDGSGNPVTTATNAGPAIMPAYNPRDFYTGAMAPPDKLNGTLIPSIAPSAYNPADYASLYPAPAAPSVPPSVLPIDTDVTQTAQLTSTPSPLLDFNPSAATPQGERSYGLPYSGAGSSASIYSDQPYVDKTTFLDPAIPSTSPEKQPIQITVPGMGTQVAAAPPLPIPRPSILPETAVATETDTAPIAPPPSRASFQPGMMNRAIQPPPSVTLASGKTVPAGTTGTSQGGRYSYTVLPDGSVLNTTTNRISAPGSVYSSGPMPSSAPSSTVPSLLQGIQDVWNKTPMGHVSQYLSGKPVEGGLLSLVPKPKAGNGSGFGTYWDPRTGTFVGGGQ